MTAATSVLMPAPGDGHSAVDLRVARDGEGLTWQATVAGRAATTAELDAAVCAGLAAGVPISDNRGGRLVLQPGPGGLRGPFGGSARLATGWSTNAVSLVRLGGTSVVHKRYRRSRPDLTEAEALRVLHGSDLAPSLIGSYTYVDHGGVRWPLGVLSDQVPGAGMDVPLRVDLRRRLADGTTTPGADTVRLLTAFGAMLRTLHHRLATTAESEVALDRPGLLDAASVEIERLDVDALRSPGARRPTDDGPLPDGAVLRDAAERVRAALRGELAAVRRQTLRPGSAGPGHGDLHLGHVLIDRSGPGRARLRVVDLSPPSLSPADAAFARQHPWQDLVSLSRALEYFTLEEAHRHVADEQGVSEGAVTAAALAGAIGDAAPRILMQRIGTTESAVARWRQAVFAAVLRGYGVAPGVVGEPLYRLLFLRRLVHELGYDLAHRRIRYAAQNLRRALDFPR